LSKFTASLLELNVRQLDPSKRHPDARSYKDLALTPVTDDDSEDAFVTSGHAHAHAKAALVTLG
jgi:hypothetical protein